MKASDEGWDSRVSAWAHSRRDIKSLVQIGSRVQKGSTVDAWSDYDYQIITSNPEKYRSGKFTGELGACWACSAEMAFGNALKVTGIYDEALEADFVILSHWDVLIAATAIRWPSTSAIWPAPLRKGVSDLRIVAAPGWKIIKGGDLWQERYSRITAASAPLEEREFTRLCDEFWVQLVWSAKKAERGEWLASQRAIHSHLVENSLRLFQEAAVFDGRRSYPLGRRAESWLNAAQLRALAMGTRPDRKSLMGALMLLSEEFAAASAQIANRNRWSNREYPEVRAWLAEVVGSSKE